MTKSLRRWFVNLSLAKLETEKAVSNAICPRTITTKLKRLLLTHNWPRWQRHTGSLILFTLQPNLVWLTT